MVFPGAFNWPVWVGQDRGLFAEKGVSVQVAETPGSVVQWTSLAEGHSDLAITLMDNVVAYREGQGEAPVTVPDAIAVMASDATAMPTLVTRPDIKSYADLRGQTLSVDAVLTGLALVLFGLLENGGLKKGDYKIVRTGGVIQRFEGLKRHEFAGALFNPPFSRQLEALGFHPLDTAASLMRNYQGHVVAARQSWAEKNKQAQALQTKLEQGGTVLSDQVRSQTEKELEKLQREIQFSQQDAQTEVNEMTQQLQAEFQQKLAPVVEQIATEKGLQIVFSARDVGALYFNPALDLTDEIIKRFDAILGEQICDISVDGKKVGQWKVTEADRKHRWRNHYFLVPGTFITNDSVEMGAKAVSAERDINMFQLWFYQPA